MTYFGVLAVFLLPPVVLLLLLVPRDIWRKRMRGVSEIQWRPYWIVLAHIIIAMLYTTPWDNYLVANGVWWYDPYRVAGITLGWVPLEEYLFFGLQTLLTGLWTIWLLRRLTRPAYAFNPNRRMRFLGSGLVMAVGLASLVVWLSGWPQATYLTLILVWAMLPILIQVSFGGDILVHNWRIVSLAVALPTLYLWLVDSVAIHSGTWTIDPGQTTGLALGSLPVEEMVFFLLTNLIVTCGVVLMLSAHSQPRAAMLLRRLTREQSNLPGNPNATS